jgi:hypothetical protein
MACKRRVPKNQYSIELAEGILSPLYSEWMYALRQLTLNHGEIELFRTKMFNGRSVTYRISFTIFDT